MGDDDEMAGEVGRVLGEEVVLVILESPFAGNIEKNLEYGRKCMKDCFMRGEFPFASHLLYTQDGVLDDMNEEERKLGIKAGLCWGRFADKTVVYTDLGISDGMKIGIEEAKKVGRIVEFRELGGNLLLKK